MEKCMVSGCPNRASLNNRAVLNRPPKRFFKFPKDPARVKVWLAALREMEKDPSEQHLICEDHFLPEDISRNGIKNDSIPLMPPYLDGLRSLMSPWVREPLQEEEQWVSMDWDGDDEEEASAAAGPPQQNPDVGQKDPPGPQTSSDLLSRRETSGLITDTPLSLLTRGFLELLMESPDASVDIVEVEASLQSPTHRVQKVISILRSLGLVQKESECRVKWTGTTSIFSFLWRTPLKFLSSLEKLKQVENQLDGLLKSCSQQLFGLTDDPENAPLAYVTIQDVARLEEFQDQTLIAIRAPSETKLNIPPPDKKETRMHLMSCNGEIRVLTCDLGSGDPLTSDPKGSSGEFTTLERSRVKTYLLHRVRPTISVNDAGSGIKWKTRKPENIGLRCQSTVCEKSAKLQCSSFREVDREWIFRNFWDVLNWDQRIQVVRSLVDVVPVQRRPGAVPGRREFTFHFNLRHGEQRRRVCKVLFLATLGVNEWFVLKWVQGKSKSKGKPDHDTKQECNPTGERMEMIPTEPSAQML
uniref:E2F transcription factor 6 n=2 Tax=Nothobranchius kuhntae TaxID=321403 RepID=A0A1A8J3P1_NOTKU